MTLLLDSPHWLYTSRYTSQIMISSVCPWYWIPVSFVDVSPWHRFCVHTLIVPNHQLKAELSSHCLHKISVDGGVHGGGGGGKKIFHKTTEAPRSLQHVLISDWPASVPDDVPVTATSSGTDLRDVPWNHFVKKWRIAHLWASRADRRPRSIYNHWGTGQSWLSIP